MEYNAVIQLRDRANVPHWRILLKGFGYGSKPLSLKTELQPDYSIWAFVLLFVVYKLIICNTSVKQLLQ